jgi:hypothetical protein
LKTNSYIAPRVTASLQSSPEKQKQTPRNKPEKKYHPAKNKNYYYGNRINQQPHTPYRLARQSRRNANPAHFAPNPTNIPLKRHTALFAHRQKTILQTLRHPENTTQQLHNVSITNKK